MIIKVKSCQRCGKDHPTQFDPLINAVDEFNYWGMCVNVGQPILMKIVET